MHAQHPRTRRRLRSLASAALIGVFALAAPPLLGGCEDAGDDIEDVGEDIGDGVEDAADEVEDTIDDINDEPVG